MTAEPSDSPLRPVSEPALHVLHVADRDIFIRFGRMLRHVTLALCADDLQVALLTDDPQTVADLDGTPVECHHFPRLSRPLSWGLAGTLRRELDELPDAVHLWGTAHLQTVGEWAAREGLPVLVQAFSVRDIERLCQIRLRPNVHLAAACPALVSLCQGYAPALAERFELLPPAFLPPEPPPEMEDADCTLGVLWVGVVDAGAGLRTLVQAVEQLRRKQADIQAVLVGTGPGTADLRQYIRQMRVQDCVSLVDEPALWDRAMHGADVLVVPARQEDLGLAPLLAMSLGKVVLASRNQLADWFVEDQTCWQFTPGAAVELAYHLSRVAADDRHARELSQSAAGYVRKNHAIGRVAAELVATYRTLAGAGSVADGAAGGEP